MIKSNIEMMTRQQALELGLVRYNDGSCCRNHRDNIQGCIRYVKTKKCLTNVRQSTKKWDQANKEHRNTKQNNRRQLDLEGKRAKERTYYQANREKIRAEKRESYYQNIEKEKLRKARYRKFHPEKYKEWCASRRAVKHHATSNLSLIEKKAIQWYYKQAEFFSNLYGISFEVDHRIPIAKGGLHHPMNLQILTKEENRKKWCKINIL